MSQDKIYQLPRDIQAVLDELGKAAHKRTEEEAQAEQCGWKLRDGGLVEMPSFDDGARYA